MSNKDITDSMQIINKNLRILTKQIHLYSVIIDDNQLDYKDLEDQYAFILYLNQCKYKILFLASLYKSLILLTMKNRVFLSIIFH